MHHVKTTNIVLLRAWNPYSNFWKSKAFMGATTHGHNTLGIKQPCKRRDKIDSYIYHWLLTNPPLMNMQWTVVHHRLQNKLMGSQLLLVSTSSHVQL